MPPAEFTALRNRLSAAAKKRGDPDAAREIAAARRPTMAAWVVNVLVRTDPGAATRIKKLTDRLRAAHAAMDGPRIRELSAEQRKLVHELAGAGFAGAGIDDPTAACATMSPTPCRPRSPIRRWPAARPAERAEEWSGFGDFGLVITDLDDNQPEPEPNPKEPEPEPDPELDAAILCHERAVEAQARAELARAEASDVLADRQAELDRAEQRHEAAQQVLTAAEADLERAETALAQALSELESIRNR